MWKVNGPIWLWEALIWFSVEVVFESPGWGELCTAIVGNAFKPLPLFLLGQLDSMITSGVRRQCGTTHIPLVCVSSTECQNRQAGEIWAGTTYGFSHSDIAEWPSHTLSSSSLSVFLSLSHSVSHTYAQICRESYTAWLNRIMWRSEQSREKWLREVLIWLT